MLIKTPRLMRGTPCRCGFDVALKDWIKGLHIFTHKQYLNSPALQLSDPLFFLASSLPRLAELMQYIVPEASAVHPWSVKKSQKHFNEAELNFTESFPWTISLDVLFNFQGFQLCCGFVFINSSVFFKTEDCGRKYLRRLLWNRQPISVPNIWRYFWCQPLQRLCRFSQMFFFFCLNFWLNFL